MGRHMIFRVVVPVIILIGSAVLTAPVHAQTVPRRLTGTIRWSNTGTSAVPSFSGGIANGSQAFSGETHVSLVLRNGQWVDDGTSTVAGQFKSIIHSFSVFPPFAPCTQTRSITLPTTLWTTLRNANSATHTVFPFGPDFYYGLLPAPNDSSKAFLRIDPGYMFGNSFTGFGDTETDDCNGQPTVTTRTGHFYTILPDTTILLNGTFHTSLPIPDPSIRGNGFIGQILSGTLTQPTRINFANSYQFTFIDRAVTFSQSTTIAGIVQESQLELLAGTGNGPDDPGTEMTRLGQDVTPAQFPLGSRFFLQLITRDQSGNPVPVASSFTLQPGLITPAINEPTIFPNNVVIEYDQATSTDIKFFQAVHLGTVTLTITPADPSNPSTTVQLTINAPLLLGALNNEVDPLLTTLGHQRGIPPHYLKGQIEKESAFNPTAYRYEVLSVDMRYISAGQNLRARLPYSLYRLATSDGLLQGTDILQADISPRSIYDITVGLVPFVHLFVTRPIADTDTLVSADNIYLTNDDTAHWSTYSPGRAAQVATNPALLEFTAQTPLAASYGFLQILYSTAIAPMGWSGVGGARNPSFLFDTDANIAGGGGSVSLGSAYLRRIFARANPLTSVATPTYDSPADFVDAFTNAFNMYNHASVTGLYGFQVISNSEAFSPIAATPIFP